MNRTSIILPALLAVLAGSVHAEPSSRVAWTPATLALVKNGNAGHGQQLAEKQGCEGCHGGNAMPEAPSLNGQSANYLFRQLHDYKDGSRASGAMSAVAGALNEKDMADLAAWYAKQGAPAAAPAGGNTDTAQRLANQGDNQRLMPSCAACHGGGGQGRAQDVPRLAGQKAAYLAATLAAYKAGRRHNDVYGRMRALAESLSPDEIKQLAAYYAGLD